MHKRKIPYKVKFVQQLHENGCSLACMAMITGLNYDFIDKQFSVNFDKNGLIYDKVRQYVCEQGFDCIEKINRIYTKVGSQNLRMLVPFADVHFISAQQFADSKYNHSFVMLKNGKILDPADHNHNHKTVLDRFYSIDVVLGFWQSKY